MTPVYRAALLEDANRILSYASRAGIRLGPAIFEARDSLSKNIDNAEFSTSELESLLSEAIGAIAPITLLHLREEVDPFSASIANSGRRIWARRTLLSIAAMVLILIVNVTFHVKEGNAAIAALTDIAAGRFEQSFQKVLWELQSDQLKNRQSVFYAVFETDVAELLRIAGRRVTTLTIANEAIHPPYTDIVDNLSALAGDFLSLFRKIGAPASSSGDGPIPEQSSFFAAQKADQIYNECYAKPPTGPTEVALKPNWDWVENLNSQNNINLCLTKTLGLGVSANATFDYSTHIISTSLDLYSSWVLPMLYGALGSIVFLFRNLGNVRTPDLNSAECFLRISLGAVAGVAVGWFSHAPDQHQLDVATAPLALAFIAGFSTDVFFALIDKAIDSFRAALFK